MECLNLIISKSNKNEEKIYLNGYGHVKNTETKVGINYRCSNRKCKGKCQLNFEKNKVQSFTAHTCNLFKTKDEIEAEFRFQNIMKANILSKPAQILTKYHGEISEDVNLLSDNKLRDRIAYKRRIEFGNSSSSNREDAERILSNAKTIDDKSFVLFNDENLVIFTTIDDLERLMGNDKWMADGTFSLAPKNYEQLFIISVKIHEIWYPCIFSLIKSRTSNSYDQLWQTLIDKAIENTIDIPDEPSLILDFELASSNSFQNMFPNGTVYRCHFHFWKTILKNLKKQNVYNLYLNDTKFNQAVKKIGSLAYLPEKDVVTTFLEIQEEFPSEADLFAKYVDKTFVRGTIIRTVKNGKTIYRKPKYNISEWNVFKRFEDDLERTTNIQESLNNRLQFCNYAGNHPTLFQLSKLLLDYHQRTVHTMNQHIIAGMPERKRRRQDRERENNLRRLFEKFSDNIISKYDYMLGCSGNLTLF